MNTKQQAGNYYALRFMQTRFRKRGDTINVWEDNVLFFNNNHSAKKQVNRWNDNKCDGFVYAFVGLKVAA